MYLAINVSSSKSLIRSPLLDSLKSKSPSCGNTAIYDGTFSENLVEGKGLSARLLEENGIKVFNEYELEELKKFIKKNRSL